MLIDTHAHLNDGRYNNEKLNEIINNLKDNNIEKVITVSYDKESCFRNLEICNKFNGIYMSIGVHPSNSFENLDFLNEIKLNSKIVAVGEIGLDYHYENINKIEQKECFIKQIKFAYLNKLPIIIHLRDAYEDMLNILKEYKEYLIYGAVVHCYSGSVEYAKELLKLGLYISFTGVITFKNAKKSLEVIKEVPLDRIMIETDCPYLCPEPFRSQLNEPKFVNLVFEKIAEIKNIDKEKLDEILRENTRKFFKI
ncbi:MAG: TatD family deoxyribonuclease [Clostridiales bacterium]|nr:TatD family deoxyribonuclease [Clostridiales bacterium]